MPLPNTKADIANHVYNSLEQYHNSEEMVLLVAFAGQMIATSIFNNVIETDLDRLFNSFHCLLNFACKTIKGYYLLH